MSDLSKKQNLFFMSLGVAAACSGLLLTFKNNTVLGICSIIVGIDLAIRNYKEYKRSNNN